MTKSAEGGSGFGRGRTLFLLATVFASGASVMVLEMTAVRALQPFFGSTNLIWANVIAVVLAALSVGYAVGGWLADRRPSALLLYAVLAGGGALLFAGAYLVTPVSKLFLADDLDLEGMLSVLMRGSLGTALVVFAPPVVFLGMISPMAIRLLSERGVGRAAGRVFSLSTVGSIAGTYLPVLWLVPAIGSRGSILVAAGILLAFGALGLVVFGRRRGIASAVVLMAVSGFAFATGGAGDPRPDRGTPVLLDGFTPTVLGEYETPYHYLSLREDVAPDGERWMVMTINDALYAFHALKVEGRVLTGSPEYDAYTLLPALLDLEPEDELRTCVVGLAAGSCAVQWKHFWGDLVRLTVDGAEIDPEIVRLGRESFGMPGPEAEWLRVFTVDGRQLLAALPEEARYRLIVLDAFANDLYVPFHLATREFFELCRGRLEPGGILAMNVFTGGEESPGLRAIENTLATVFGGSVRTRAGDSVNCLLVARAGENGPDLARLSTVPLVNRFRHWPDFRARRADPEWEHFLQVGQDLADAAMVVEPSADERILTDDHSPIEHLTDLQLAGWDALTLAGGGEAAAALTRLHERQNRLLAWIGGGWLGAFAAAGAAAFFHARRRRPASQGVGEDEDGESGRQGTT